MVKLELSPEQQQRVQDLLQNHSTAVLATADHLGAPSAAVVLFATEPDGTIIFGTHQTRKYRNLKDNPQAALVVTRDYTAIQMHGTATELQGADAAAAKQFFMAKHPEADQHMMAGSLFFRFSPSWLRYIDTGVKPPIQWEITATH